MVIFEADRTPNINNHKYLPTLFTSVVNCFMVFKVAHRNDPTITSQPIGSDTDPFVHSGTIACSISGTRTTHLLQGKNLAH